MYLSIMYERRFNMWVILGGFRSWGHPINPSVSPKSRRAGPPKRWRAGKHKVSNFNKSIKSIR